MHHTKSDIFWKCWLWSCVSGLIAAILFWLISSIGNIFHWSYGGETFIDLLTVFAVAGTYFGSGYVGWRIADKYHHDPQKLFVKRYTLYAVITFVLLVAVTYSPLSLLGLLWSLIAPFCTIKALDYVKAQSAK